MPYVESVQTRTPSAQAIGTRTQAVGSQFRRPQPHFQMGQLGTNAIALVSYLDTLLSAMASHYDIQLRIQWEINLQRLRNEIQCILAAGQTSAISVTLARCAQLGVDMMKAFGAATGGHDAVLNDPNVAAAHGRLSDIRHCLSQVRA